MSNANPTDPALAGDPRAWLADMLQTATAGALGAIVVMRLSTPTEAAAGGGTLWIAQFSFLALLAWLAARYASGGLGLCWSLFDLALALVVGGNALGAGVVFWIGGDRRSALNLLWEWLSVGTTVFLLARLPHGKRTFATCVMATAAGLAILGIWQHHVGYKGLAEAYRKLDARWRQLSDRPQRGDPAWAREMARLEQEFAINGIPLDPRSRQMWEQRALHSSEPYGLFGGLTNTLAGVLAPGLILCVGWLRRGWKHCTSPWWLVPAVGTATMGYCLLLTKSRTAWAGLLVGLATWIVLKRRENRIRTSLSRRGRQIMWAALLGIAVVAVAIAAGTGGLDRLVISEASKSLGYRLEWWGSTWEMLTSNSRSMLAGVGLGNFRSHYLPHKLPHSSEEILDPHNLVLDAWSNGGLLAAAGIVVLLIAMARAILRQSAGFSQGGHQRELEEQRKGFCPPSGRLGREPALWGMLLGPACVLLLEGSYSDQLWVVWGVGVLVAACISLCGEAWGVPEALGAFACLVVHLLGAGGWGMPAIAILLLGLAAGFGSVQDEDRHCPPTLGWRWSVTGLVCVALFVGGWLNMRVVLTSTLESQRGDDELMRNRNWRVADRAYAKAIAADPISAELQRRRAAAAFGVSQGLRDSARARKEFQNAVRYQQEALALDPYQHSAYRELGQMYWERFKSTKQPDDAREATRWLGEALRRYPNLAALQVMLADAASGAEDGDLARRAAAGALEIHAANVAAGHPDKQLPAEDVARMKRFAVDRD